MLGWNKITQLTSKAGGAVSKVKDFAKDLITVDAEENNANQDFQQAFAQLQKGYGLESSENTKSPEAASPQRIEMQELKKYNQEFEEVKSLFVQKNITSEDSEQSLTKLDTLLNSIAVSFQEQITRLQDQVESQSLSEVGVLINQFFIQIQRQSAFYDRFLALKQKGSNKELLSLIEKSLANTGQEILQSKQEMQQNKRDSQSNENVQLQKKIVEMQDKLSTCNGQIKDQQNRIKELEKYSSEWDKIKRDYTEEIKQNFNEIENLKGKLKQKETDLQQSYQDLQKVIELRTLVDQKTEEIERLEKLLEEWQRENQQLQSELKAVSLQLEAEKDQREKLSKKFQEEFKKLRSEANKEDLSQLKNFKESNEKLKSMNSQLKLQVEELSIANETILRNQKEIQTEVQALQHKIRSDQNYVNNMVDKRVIANVLIQYLDFSTEFKVKMQILETLSSLLDLTKDERDKISMQMCYIQCPSKNNLNCNLISGINSLGFLKMGNDLYNFNQIMKALLQQAMQQIKIDSELARLLGQRSDAELIIQKLKLVFEKTLDDHTELYWKKEHAHTKSQLECSIQECLSLRHDLREMDDERTHQAQIIKEQNKQIDELQLTLGEIEQKLNLMQENVLAQKQELAEEFELNLNQIQDSYKQKEEQQIKQLEAKLVELEQVVSDQQNALRKEREISGQISNDTKQIKSHLKCEQETTTNLRQQLQVLKKTNETLNIDKQCLDNRSKQLKQQNETLHKQVRSLETKIIDLNEECERFKKKSQHESTNYKSQQSEQEKVFKRKIRNYKLQVGDMKNKLKVGLQKIFANLKLEMDSFKLQTLKEIQLVQTQICQMINKQLRSDYELKERDFSDKMEQIRYSMQAHFKTTLEKQAIELEHKIVQQKNEYEQIIKNLKQQIQQLEEIKRDLENDLQIKQVECEEHQLLLDEKMKILNDQQKQLSEISEQAKDQLNLLMEQDENIKQLIEENQKLQKKTQQYEELVSKQAVVYQSTKVEDKMYKKQYEDLNQSNQHLRKQIQILQEQQLADQNLITKLKSQASTGKLNTIKDVEDRHLLRLQYIRKI